jgi:hypothetical protein
MPRLISGQPGYEELASVDRSSTGMSPSLPPPTGAELDGHAAGGSTPAVQAGSAGLPSHQQAPLRTQLQTMSTKQLRELAVEKFISQDEIEDARDSEAPKPALIALIQKNDAELQKNDADLQAMSLKQLRQRATTDGIDDDAIEVSPIVPLLLPSTCDCQVRVPRPSLGVSSCFSSISRAPAA